MAETVRLRIVCENPPPVDGSSVMFGLQDKKPSLIEGTLQADGALHFGCVLAVKREGDTANFLGAFAHGTPKERFLYLSYGRRDGNGFEWIRRIKVQLGTIPLELLDNAIAEHRALVARIDGRRAASVRPMWTLE
jgi:hypothetical protein